MKVWNDFLNVSINVYYLVHCQFGLFFFVVGPSMSYLSLNFGNYPLELVILFIGF